MAGPVKRDSFVINFFAVGATNSSRLSGLRHASP